MRNEEAESHGRPRRKQRPGRGRGVRASAAHARPVVWAPGGRAGPRLPCVGSSAPASCQSDVCRTCCERATREGAPTRGDGSGTCGLSGRGRTPRAAPPPRAPAPLTARPVSRRHRQQRLRQRLRAPGPVQGGEPPAARLQGARDRGEDPRRGRQQPGRQDQLRGVRVRTCGAPGTLGCCPECREPNKVPHRQEGRRGSARGRLSGRPAAAGVVGPPSGPGEAVAGGVGRRRAGRAGRTPGVGPRAGGARDGPGGSSWLLAPCRRGRCVDRGHSVCGQGTLSRPCHAARAASVRDRVAVG